MFKLAVSLVTLALLAFVFTIVFPLWNQVLLASNAEAAMDSANHMVAEHQKAMTQQTKAGMCNSLKSCAERIPEVKQEVEKVQKLRARLWASFRPSITTRIDEFLCRAEFGDPSKGETCSAEHVDD